MTDSDSLLACTGCGAFVPDIEGPTHRYVGASPGCWAVYSEVVAREYGEYRYPSVHRLTVDTYAVQHPGTPSRQSIQSVAVHLISLHVVLERSFKPGQAIEVIRAALQYPDRYVWLEPPPSLGGLTIVDVSQAKDLSEHEEIVERWAWFAWDAWSPHHDAVRAWAEQVGV